jgi:hypothetical protein
MENVDAMDETELQIIRREGEYWTIVFGGATCRLRDARGLHQLAYLLCHPYEPVSCLILERLEHERELPEELSDRARVAPHDARERARVNVTRAISSVLRRIAGHLPDLGKHLAATVKTGAFCSYTPDPRLPSRWTQ